MPATNLPDRRLVQLYDFLNGDRSDLAAYAVMVKEFGARSILDIGCGTGTFACLLASLRCTVTGVDPSVESLDIARAKPGADLVQWVHGYVSDLPALQADLATMTANVAQEIVTDEDWAQALRGTYAALRPGGRLVFETRDPAAGAWLSWNREQSYQHTVIPCVGGVEHWFEVTDVSGELVTFSGTYIFESDNVRLTATSSLRFRTRETVTASLTSAGYRLDEIRQAPDRPGRELVFIAQRPE
jgi:ubiquinone/menaquinone biosynthesis C-methylase UbiE